MEKEKADKAFPSHENSEHMGGGNALLALVE